MLTTEEIMLLGDVARHYERNLEKIQKMFRSLPKVHQIVVQAGQHVSELGTQANKLEEANAYALEKLTKNQQMVSLLQADLERLSKVHEETRAHVNEQCQQAIREADTKVAEAQLSAAKKIKEAEEHAQKQLDDLEAMVAAFTKECEDKKLEIQLVIDELTGEKILAEDKLAKIQEKLAEIKSRL